MPKVQELMVILKQLMMSVGIPRLNSSDKLEKPLQSSSDSPLSVVKKDQLIPPEIQEVSLSSSTLKKVTGIW